MKCVDCKKYCLGCDTEVFNYGYEENKAEECKLFLRNENMLFKFKDIDDKEIKEIEAYNEEKAWIKLLGYHVCKYSEAVYVSEIRDRDWKLI